MKRILRLTLLFSFTLLSVNGIWHHLTFENQTLTLIKTAAILAFFEIILKPIIKLLLLPINILTLGLIRVVINTLGFYLATFLLDDFQVNSISIPPFQWQGFTVPTLHFTGFLAYLVTSISTGLILNLYNYILKKRS